MDGSVLVDKTTSVYHNGARGLLFVGIGSEGLVSHTKGIGALYSIFA